MFIVTTDFISGKQVETLGLVIGNMVQTKNLGRDIGAGLKSLVGGELRDYTKMMNEARDEATRRMMAQAEACGADAVIGVRYQTNSMMQGAAECICYGTAVKFVE